MQQSALSHYPLQNSFYKSRLLLYGLSLLLGLVGPLGFAPFHLPGLLILSIAGLYSLIITNQKSSFALGFFYGLGYFTCGVSWVIVSIHSYGEINYFLSGLIVLGFISYLSLFPAICCMVFYYFKHQKSQLFNTLLFGCIWVSGEYIRAHLFTGFPWLLIGSSQIDTPLKYCLPIVGIYGVSLLVAISAALIIAACQEQTMRRYYYVIAFVLIIITPSALQKIDWTQSQEDAVTIGAVQANLAMRSKWDEALLWDILKNYEHQVNKLLGKQVIILPESSIPLPSTYLQNYLQKLHRKAIRAKTSLLMGIVEPTDSNQTNFYNSMISLGNASGTYAKRQLVPFGEYIPQPFRTINDWLNLPSSNVIPGKNNQPLIKIANHRIASLICYELAYPQLLRQQLPIGEWIVSISDNGWFGHSFASYQQLQMAQVLAILTGRFHVVVNNDGLSSIINPNGDIMESLPPFSSGILQGIIYPLAGSTPWVIWGNSPVFILCSIFLVFAIFFKTKCIDLQEAIAGKHKRGYP